MNRFDVSTAFILVVGFLTIALGMSASAVDVRVDLEEGYQAVLRNGRSLFLECDPPSGPSAEPFFARVLARPQEWKIYAGKGRVAIPYRSLRSEVHRVMLLAIFTDDYVDESGWTHVVRFAGEGRGQETLWSLSEWLTGNGFNQDLVMKANELETTTLQVGQRIFFPRELLREVMWEPTSYRNPPEQAEPSAEEPHEAVENEINIEPVDEPLRSGDESYSTSTVDAAVVPQPRSDNSALLADLNGYADLLSYGEDEEGPYALYHLQRGDASLYTPVVVRFTDYRENVDILVACDVIQRRSRIRDVTDMETGQPIKIPLDMLAARFLPSDHPRRIAYEETMREAQRLRGEQPGARNLDGVVVILDPGHGGRDPGAIMTKNGFSLYEDEIVYDIASRIREILLTTTNATVYMTLLDPMQGYTPTNATRFQHDENEILLTSPPYENTNSTYSANLRSYLANSIYRRELANGVDERNIIFTSIHTDALFNETLRGAMIYVPGAPYRRDSERPSPDSFYDRFAEAREQRTFTSTASERQRDEALSRNFAEVLLDELGKQRVKRFDKGPPIRNVIRRSGGRFFLPAVLRNTEVPTKILVEAANMTNRTDCERLSDPAWRQRFAQAYVNALLRYYEQGGG